jgi:hypothetical protein
MIGLALAVPVVAFAQKAPRFEAFGGYSYGMVWGYVADQIVPGSGNSTFPRFGSNGWTGSVAVNPTRLLGAEVFVGGLYTNLNIPSGETQINLRMHERSYLFGPRFSYRSERWTLFAHGLFGEAHASVALTEPEMLTPLGFVETKLAMGVGGGLEFTLDPGGRRGVGFRPMQMDWIRTSFAGTHQGILWLSTGLVFRF